MTDYCQMWKDVNSDKSYLIKTGGQRNVREDGRNCAKFNHRMSGFLNFKQRMKMAKKTKSIMPDLPTYLSSSYDGESMKPKSSARESVRSGYKIFPNKLDNTLSQSSNIYPSISNKSLPASSKKKAKGKKSAASHSCDLKNYKTMMNIKKLNPAEQNSKFVELSPQGLVQRAPTIKQMHETLYPSINKFYDPMRKILALKNKEAQSKLLQQRLGSKLKDSNAPSTCLQANKSDVASFDTKNPLKQNKMVPFYSIKSSIKNLGKTVTQNSTNEDESTLKFNQILDDVEIESASSQNSTYNSSFYPQRLRSKTELRKECNLSKRMEKMTLNIDNAYKKAMKKQMKRKPRRTYECGNPTDLWYQDIKWMKKANPVPFEYAKMDENNSKKLASNSRKRKMVKQNYYLSRSSQEHFFLKKVYQKLNF
ncbi:unnamed protein product [Moneuplotes crassus]|uniref:Uncharacterized protein n=1 Tax=Euplotes crassus TaxID=5936 RepID=A0AAD1UK92_EUPCR|nr:unnamed protein product [Moneuplotes crassus]